MGFTKLDSGITKSSIWAEPYYVRILWITFLAEKDQDGFVGASISGIQRSANITMEECLSGLDILSSPDTDSRSSEYEGRRIEKVERGWVILNHKKFRDFTYSGNSDAIRMREKRANKNEHVRNDTNISVSVSSSECNEEGIALIEKSIIINEIIETLNSVCKTAFKANRQSTVKHIQARLKECFSIDDFRHVICYKNEEWSSNPEMSQYLRPDTLFGTKFESYLQAAKKTGNEQQKTTKRLHPDYDPGLAL